MFSLFLSVTQNIHPLKYHWVYLLSISLLHTVMILTEKKQQEQLMQLIFYIFLRNTFVSLRFSSFLSNSIKVTM